jgi:hypothetical protein
MIKNMNKTPKKLLTLSTDAYNSRSGGGFAQRISDMNSQGTKDYNRISRRSNDSNYLNISKSGVNLVQDKFDFIRSK